MRLTIPISENFEEHAAKQAPAPAKIRAAGALPEIRLLRSQNALCDLERVAVRSALVPLLVRYTETELVCICRK